MSDAWMRGLLAVMGLAAFVAGGCTGVQTFPMVARAGDTVAVSLGWQPQATRAVTRILIKDSTGNKTIYEPGDPRLRALVQLFPDPASYLVVSTATGTDFRSEESVLGVMAAGTTGGDPEWLTTTAFVDLPVDMPPGPASINAEINGELAIASRAGTTLEVLPGEGAPHPFTVPGLSGDGTARLQSLERSVVDAVVLTGDTTPYAAALTFAHDPDAAHGGQGQVHVVNMRGDRRNLSWSDSGTELTVVIMPASDQALTLRDFKFYVAGGVTGLEVTQARGFHADGSPLSVAADIVPRVASLSSATVSAGDTLTIEGNGLCIACGQAGDTRVWLRSSADGGWVEAPLNAVTPHALSVVVPATAVTGVVLVSTVVGDGSSWVTVQ